MNDLDPLILAQKQAAPDETETPPKTRPSAAQWYAAATDRHALADLVRRQPDWSGDLEERQALLISKREAGFLMEIIGDWQLKQSAQVMFSSTKLERRLCLTLDTKIRRFYFRGRPMEDDPEFRSDSEMERAMLDPFAGAWKWIRDFARDFWHGGKAQ